MPRLRPPRPPLGVCDSTRTLPRDDDGSELLRSGRVSVHHRSVQLWSNGEGLPSVRSRLRGHVVHWRRAWARSFLRAGRGGADWADATLSTAFAWDAPLPPALNALGALRVGLDAHASRGRGGAGARPSSQPLLRYFGLGLRGRALLLRARRSSGLRHTERLRPWGGHLCYLRAAHHGHAVVPQGDQPGDLQGRHARAGGPKEGQPHLEA